MSPGALWPQARQPCTVAGGIADNLGRMQEDIDRLVEALNDTAAADAPARQAPSQAGSLAAHARGPRRQRPLPRRRRPAVAAHRRGRASARRGPARRPGRRRRGAARPLPLPRQAVSRASFRRPVTADRRAAPLPREPPPRAGARRSRHPCAADRGPHARIAEVPHAHRGARAPVARPRADLRRDGLRQDDDDGIDRRRHQQARATAHRHDRGPDRVRAPARPEPHRAPGGGQRRA